MTEWMLASRLAISLVSWALTQPNRHLSLFFFDWSPVVGWVYRSVFCPACFACLSLRKRWLFLAPRFFSSLVVFLHLTFMHLCRQLPFDSLSLLSFTPLAFIDPVTTWSLADAPSRPIKKCKRELVSIAATSLGLSALRRFSCYPPF